MQQLAWKLKNFPYHIQPRFAYPVKSESLNRHVEHIEYILQKIVPNDILYGDQESFENWMQKSLPIIQWSNRKIVPDCFSIYLFCHSTGSSNIETFFHDLIKRWMIPGKELNILSFRHLYFSIQEIDNSVFFVSKIEVLIEEGQDLKAIESNLPTLAEEIAAGVQSESYAKYILESKALSNNQKMMLSHQDILKLLKKRPNAFDTDIFTEISRFLAISTPEFRNQRPYRHTTRLACSLYLIRKNMRRLVSLFPEKRHLLIRFIRTELQFPFGKKPVLGLLISIYLFHQKEFFEEKHITAAVQKFLPFAKAVKGSVYTHPDSYGTIRSIYVEIEKNDGTKFTTSEIQVLKKFLPDELKGRVEHLTPSVFMVRNEEETLRNILSLSQQLKYVSDLPQVMISFDRQSNDHLIFTIVFVRVLKRKDKSVQQLLQDYDPKLQFIKDRIQTVGYIRKKYPKEANVFHIQIEKKPRFFRDDSSLNLYVARQEISHILNQAFGEYRDYNGGMIVKQRELFSDFKRHFLEVSKINRDLLENFFFSLTPIEVQATLSLHHLKKFFEVFLKGLQVELTKEKHYHLEIEDDQQLFVVIKADKNTIKSHIDNALSRLKLRVKELVSCSINFQGSLCIGYLLDTQDSEVKKKMKTTILDAIKKWAEKIESYQILRLNLVTPPFSLDPRIGGDEESRITLKMLFDGLMRMDVQGNITCAIANSYKISKDQKKYTFFLRDCYWSNGSRITAYDFVYSWKKTLSPHFSTPFANLFYPIKNAKPVKQGKVSADALGIRILNDTTLEVELEYPTPHFLELTAHTLFSPINHFIDKMHPNWSTQEGDQYICNGPFKIKKYTPNYGFELEKNPLYWDVKNVELDEVIIYFTNAYTALEMYKNNEIDWIGRPMRPWEPLFQKNNNEKIYKGPNQQVCWYVFNVNRFPFTNKKLRQAFSLAVNREKIIDGLSFEASPAYTPLIPKLSQHSSNDIMIEDLNLARTLFKEALEELEIKKSNFPILSVVHFATETQHYIARTLKSLWENAFQIQIRLESYLWKNLFEKMIDGNYHLGSVNWRSWIFDQTYTLNFLRYRGDDINFSNWECKEYQELLEQSEQEIDIEKRRALYKQAEELLIKNFPIVPLFYEYYQAIKKDHLNAVFNPKTGEVDFKYASISKKR